MFDVRGFMLDVNQPLPFSILWEVLPRYSSRCFRLLAIALVIRNGNVT